jgi:hypothetical protein
MPRRGWPLAGSALQARVRRQIRAREIFVMSFRLYLVADASCAFGDRRTLGDQMAGTLSRLNTAGRQKGWFE